MKPQPKVVSRVCSACGLDWKLHTKGVGEPTLETCVTLLKAELAKRSMQQPVVFASSGSHVRAVS